MQIPFADRANAGRELAHRLLEQGLDQALIMGLPPGGVPVAAAVADSLQQELDVLLLRKLPVPGFMDLAMGAVASGGGLVFNSDVLHQLRIFDEVLETVVEQEQALLNQAERHYRGDRPPASVVGRRVIVVDDVLDDPAGVRVAVETLRQRQAAEVWVAAPVADSANVRRLQAVAAGVITIASAEAASAEWYRDASPVSAAEVRRTLEAHWARRPAGEDEALLLDSAGQPGSRVTSCPSSVAKRPT